MNARGEAHIFVVDNYDSFTYNLMQYLWELGARTTIVRNDQFNADQITWRDFDGILIGPGPGRPKDAGQTMALLASAPENQKILGICLGHQAIGEYFGATLGYAKELMHGRTSKVTHTGIGLFRNLPKSFSATRYHSLSLSQESVTSPLRVVAHSDEGEVMAITHATRPVDGIQFHPESFMTEHGHRLLGNWLKPHW